MDLLSTLRIALRALRTNTLRSGLTMLGIAALLVQRLLGALSP